MSDTIIHNQKNINHKIEEKNNYSRLEIDDNISNEISESSKSNNLNKDNNEVSILNKVKIHFNIQFLSLMIKNASIENIMNLFIIIAFNVSYILSLEYKRCNKDYYYECRILYKVFDFLLIIYFLIASSILLSLYVIFNIKIRNYDSIKLMLINLSLLLMYDHKFIIQSHGGYNFFWLLILSAFFLLLIYIFEYLFKLYKKYSNIGFVILILSMYFLFYHTYDYLYNRSCENWKKGLGNDTILNEKLTCVTPKPYMCTFEILDGIMDLPRWFNQNCSEEHGNITLLIMNSPSLLNITNITLSNEELNDIELMNKKVSQHIKTIGYPRGEKMNRIDDVPAKTVLKYILSKLFDYNQANDSIKNTTEYFIDYNEKLNRFIPRIELKPNYTMADLRNKNGNDKYLSNKEEYNTKVYEKNLNIIYHKDKPIELDKLKLNPLTKNVLVIFSDATSRRHFHRKFPKLMNFLNRHYKNNTSKLSSYQYMKHQSIYAGTLANIGAAYYGTFTKKYGYSISEKFKKHGFITGSTQNLCLAEAIDIKKEEPTVYEFEQDDHEFWTPFCDPNFMGMKGNYVDFKGPYSILKRCMWEKLSIDYSIEYATQFFEKYKNYRKFFRINTADSHETSADVVKYDDAPITNFLEKLESDGTLDDTTILIFSDHGTYSHGWFFRYFETNDWFIELKLPALFLLIPKSVKNFEYIDYNLRDRMNTMTTALDIYKTLYSLIDGSEKKKSFVDYGTGLFYNNKSVSDHQDCKFYGIKDYICMCKPIANVTNY